MQQLGLGELQGIPSLLAALLPNDTPVLARRWLRRLVLSPPKPGTAAAISHACQLLMGAPCLSPSATHSHLRAHTHPDTDSRTHTNQSAASNCLQHAACMDIYMSPFDICICSQVSSCSFLMFLACYLMQHMVLRHKLASHAMHKQTHTHCTVTRLQHQAVHMLHGESCVHRGLVLVMSGVLGLAVTQQTQHERGCASLDVSSQLGHC